MKNLILLSFIFFLSCNSGRFDETHISKSTIISGTFLTDEVTTLYITNTLNWENYLDSTPVINKRFSFEFKKGETGYTYQIIFKTKSGFKKLLAYSTPNPKSLNTAFFIDTSHLTIDQYPVDFKFSEPEIRCHLKGGRETSAFLAATEFDLTNIHNDVLNRTKELQFYQKLIQTYPTSLYLLQKIFESKALLKKYELQDLVSLFDKNVIESKLGKLVTNYIGKKVDYPIFDNFALNTPEGKRLNTIDTTSKVNMLVFWASWCGPCRKEIPGLKKIDSAFREKGVKLTSISIDEDKENWLKALEQEKMGWTQLYADTYDRAKIKNQFEITSIPMVVFIDNNRKLIKRYIGIDSNSYAEYSKVIAEIIK